MACILLWSSAVRVHDSQAYRKMDVTRECISLILELKEILLSFQTHFSLVSAAGVCAILESISGLEPSTVLTEPRYLKLATVSSFYPFTLPCKMVLARPDEREICPYHCSLRLFTMVKRPSCGPIACWTLARLVS